MLLSWRETARRVPLFERSSTNPILVPSDRWWEARAVLNPGAVVLNGGIALVYRVVGADGLSRFGYAWSADGEHFERHSALPLYEGALDDPEARLGVEDPRVTALDGKLYLTYCKASVSSADTPPLSWEPAPFRVRSAIAIWDGATGVREIGKVLPEENTKDLVLFPDRIGGQYAALVRRYPSVQYITSPDLRSWSGESTVLDPIPGTWEGERVGAGPPPLRTPWGWLLLYHGNEYRQVSGNRRMYRMGLAVLDLEDPSRLLYRHPEPVFVPEAPYEVQGPVGNVVFGTGLIVRNGRILLYYGAGDGVIGLAVAEWDVLLDLVRLGVAS